MIMANNQQNGNKGNNQSGDTSNRGFASMDPQKQREIAAEGGRAAHASGNAHEFNSEEARRAGSMSHKNDGNQQSGNRGGNNGGNNGGNQQSGGMRGGSPEQHAKAGAQSHKNDKR
jgi:general stress protein YciG